MKSHKKDKWLLGRKSSLSLRQSLGIVAGMVVVGVVVLYYSHAASANVAVAAIAGQLSGSARVVANPNATSGRDVQFGTASAVTPSPTPAPQGVVPRGVGGKWKLVFDDEFNGSSLDTSKWYVFNNVARQGVMTQASNLSESGGSLHITLASANSGAEINSWNTQGAGRPAHGFGLAYGDAVEARIWVPGSGGTAPNWPSFWTSGHTQPGDFSGGEIDIFEGLSGRLHIDYNNTTARVVGPVPAGNWLGSWHTYTAVRHGPASAATYDVYWDGKLVWHTGPYVESGNVLQGILLTNGYSARYGGPLQVPTTMLVDYVRAWAPN